MKLKWSKESEKPLNDDETVELIISLGKGWRLPTITEFKVEYALNPKEFKHVYYKCSNRGYWVERRLSGGTWGSYSYDGSNYVRCVREIESEGE